MTEEPVTFPRRGALETSLLKLVRVTGRNSQQCYSWHLSNSIRTGNPLAQSTKVVQKAPVPGFSKHQSGFQSFTQPLIPPASQGICDYSAAKDLRLWPLIAPLFSSPENDFLQVLRLKWKMKSTESHSARKQHNFHGSATSYHPDLEYHFSWLYKSQCLYL